MYNLCALPTEAKSGCYILGTGVIDCCEPSYELEKLNPGTLEEQPVFLTAQPSLQASVTYFYRNWVSQVKRIY